MSAFVRSGSAAPEYLSQLPLLGPNTLQGLTEESNYPDWFFKWVERDNRGKIKGHIAGYRLGDNLWCAGELFADPDLSQKVSTTFAKKFLEHFVDFLQRKTPTPKVYGAWKLNHPFWKNTEGFLEANPDAIFSNLLGYTFFLDPSKKMTTTVPITFTTLNGSELTEINEISTQLKDRNVFEFAHAFDFDIDRFGSPRIREKFAARNFTFRRKYIVARSDYFECLLILSRFPFGVSPYNNTSIIFALPMSGDISNFTQNFVNAIGKEAVCEGIYPHRVVLLAPPGEGTLDSALAVRALIVQPKMWLNI